VIASHQLSSAVNCCQITGCGGREADIRSVGWLSQPADIGWHVGHSTSERELYVNYNNVLFYYVKRGVWGVMEVSCGLVQMEWWPAGWLSAVIFPCTIKSTRFLLAQAHPGSPRKGAIKWLYVCVCVLF